MRLLAVGLITIIAVMGTGRSADASLIFSQDSNGNGLYSLNTSTGAATLIGAGISGVTSETVGLSPSNIDGVLYGSSWSDLLETNADGSGSNNLGGVGTEGLAMNTDSGILYGAINGTFFTVNTTTGALVTTLASPGGDVEGLAYGRDGDTIFGLADGGLLRSYSISGDSWTTIGSTGVGFDQIGLAYDPMNQILYAIGNQDSNLYRINPFDASTSIVGSTGLAASGGGLAFLEDGGTAVPEPSTLLMFGLTAGIAGLGATWVRRRKIA